MGKITDTQNDKGSSNKGKAKTVEEDQLWSICEPSLKKRGENMNQQRFNHEGPQELNIR